MAFSSRCLKIFLLCSPPAPRESRRAVECPAAVLREESAWCHPSGRCHPLSGTRETWVARFVAAFVICHPPFVICHFSFPIPRSEFRIPHCLESGTGHPLSGTKETWVAPMAVLTSTTTALASG